MGEHRDQGTADAVEEEYLRSAEYVDVMLADAWAFLGPALAEALAGVDPTAGPIVDVGAGTGRGVRVLADAFPDAEIVAVEPSAVMRAVLMARVGSRDDLRSRVTVIPGDLMTLPQDTRASAIVAMNMIGHLRSGERAAFWSRAASALATDAPMVVNLQPPSTVSELPYEMFSRVRVGRRVYVGGGGAVPSGPDSVTWTMSYRTEDEGGAILTEQRVDYDWTVLSPTELIGELTSAGFDVTQSGPPAAQLYVARIGQG